MGERAPEGGCRSGRCEKGMATTTDDRLAGCLVSSSPSDDHWSQLATRVDDGGAYDVGLYSTNLEGNVFGSNKEDIDNERECSQRPHVSKP